MSIQTLIIAQIANNPALFYGIWQSILLIVWLIATAYWYGFVWYKTTPQRLLYRRAWIGEEALLAWASVFVSVVISLLLIAHVPNIYAAFKYPEFWALKQIYGK